jgi:hypothetical protein
MADIGISWSELFSGIFGAIIGGTCSVVAVVIQSRATQAGQVATEARYIEGFLDSILEEVETVWRVYQDRVGHRVEGLGPNDGLFYVFPVFSDFFSVYHGTTFAISRVNDIELRRAIVRTYTLSKGLLDSYRLNNLFMENLSRLQALQADNDPLVARSIQQTAQQIQGYGPSLKEIHMEVKKSVDDVVNRLRLRTRRDR